MHNLVKKIIRDERGVSAMEYAILAGIIAVALGAAAATFNTGIKEMFTNMFAAVSTQQGKK
jgi:pilus assembly protein Flp/PilA